MLTEIEAQIAIKKKLNMEFRPGRILGACDPQIAYKALQAEDEISTKREAFPLTELPVRTWRANHRW